MQHTDELSPLLQQLLFAVIAGCLFCGMHLFNGWLMGSFEFSSHINLIYLPGFLRLANVLVLGLLWGTLGTAVGGLMLMWWFNETWLVGILNVGVSACVAALAVFLMQVLLQRRLSLRKLSDLVQLALLYSLLNALSHHLLWSVLDPLQLIEWQQMLYMVIGDLNGALIGAWVLRWLAAHTGMVSSVRARSIAADQHSAGNE